MELEICEKTMEIQTRYLSQSRSHRDRPELPQEEMSPPRSGISAYIPITPQPVLPSQNSATTVRQADCAVTGSSCILDRTLGPGILQEIRSSPNTILASTDRDHVDVPDTTSISHLLAVESVPIRRHGSSPESSEDDTRPATKKNTLATRKRDAQRLKRENRTDIARRIGLSKYDIKELVLDDHFSRLWSQYRDKHLWRGGKIARCAISSQIKVVQRIVVDHFKNEEVPKYAGSQSQNELISSADWMAWVCVQLVMGSASGKSTVFSGDSEQDLRSGVRMTCHLFRYLQILHYKMEPLARELEEKHRSNHTELLENIRNQVKEGREKRHAKVIDSRRLVTDKTLLCRQVRENVGTYRTFALKDGLFESDANG